MSAILCVGEALISLSPPTGTPLLTANELLVSTGGAEVNVAVNLGRLGIPTRFAGKVGADPFGARLRNTLEAAGVDTRYLEEDLERRTGLYVKDPSGAVTTMRYYRNGSAATAYRSVPDAALHGVRYAHLTGITPALGEACRALVEQVLVLPGVRTSFDVNYRRALWDVSEAGPVLQSLANRASTVFVGLDEADEVWGCRSPEDVRTLLPEPKELVVKDGSREAVVFAGAHMLRVPARPVEVVEPVGAGDAFAAGYLAARYLAHPPRQALHWGHALAGAVLKVSGDHAPMDRVLLEELAAHGAEDTVVR